MRYGNDFREGQGRGGYAKDLHAGAGQWSMSGEYIGGRPDRGRPFGPPARRFPGYDAEMRSNAYSHHLRGGWQRGYDPGYRDAPRRGGGRWGGSARPFQGARRADSVRVRGYDR